MASILLVSGSLISLYALNLLYKFAKNLVHARSHGHPYVVAPVDQNSLLWLVTSIPLRPWFKNNLPTWLWHRISLTIYGFEFTEKMRPFEQYGAPQGNDQSYVLVTPGTWEFSTRDVELAYEILRRPRDFQQAEIAAGFMGKFGPNLLTSNGDVWTRQRRIIASAINERISRTVFEESSIHAKGLVDEVVGSRDDTTTNKLFDMMKKITINVLSGASMGATVAWLDKERPRPGHKMTYIAAVQVLLNAIAGPIILPDWFLRNYPTFLPGAAFLQALRQAIHEFPSHTWYLFDSEREKMKHGQSAGTNILSQLSQALGQDGKDGSSMQTLSKEETLSNLFIFTVAGFETTANTLSYALILLARYPEWQKWVFEEIDAIVPVSGDLEYTEIYPKATRIMAVMLEVLRMFPPLIHMLKSTKTPQTVKTSNRTYHFPAGGTVYINNIAIHRDPKVYRNLNLHPNETFSDDDENIFRPSRWITSLGGLYQPPKGTYIPWSTGPRICPGQKMAQVEFTAIFLQLFRNHGIDAAHSPAENRSQVERRLEKAMENSMPIVTLQMMDVYDVDTPGRDGLNLRLKRRK